MRAVHVGVGREDYLVVAQFIEVERLAYRGAERHDEVLYLLGSEHAVEPRALDVEYLAAQREYRLRAAVAPGLGAAACRVALYHEQL